LEVLVLKYYESAAYGKVCEDTFGIDLKQRGMMSKPELDILLKESNLNETHNVLEVGCGAGQIAAYINKQTSARITGIDIDEEVVEWASSACRGNNDLCFHVLDVRNISETNEKYSKILAIDSLYFLSDMKVETFFESLKSTIKDLYALVEDDGELIVSWSELPFFKPEGREPKFTQLGICLEELGYPYRSIDLTSYETEFWKMYKRALVFHEKDFINEGNGELYESSVKEAAFFIEGANKNQLYRNLYFIQK
jgi:SAM-dependent methyltransferase